MARLKAIALNCSLKADAAERSSTDAMIDMLRAAFAGHDVDEVFLFGQTAILALDDADVPQQVHVEAADVCCDEGAAEGGRA